MTKNKLETYSNKKKFSAVKESDYEFCVSIFLKFWTVSGSNLDLDPRFLKDLLDIKSLSFSFIDAEATADRDSPNCRSAPWRIL